MMGFLVVFQGKEFNLPKSLFDCSTKAPVEQLIF